MAGNCYASGLELIGDRLAVGQYQIGLYAAQAVDQTVAAADDLSSFLSSLNFGVLTYQNSVTPPDDFESPPDPDPQAVEFVKPLLDYSADLVIPNFTATATAPADFTTPAPVVSPGERPGDLNVEDVGPAPVVGTYTFPDDPTEEIPPVPTLTPIIVPDMPLLDLPTFDATEPDDLVEDGFGTFSWEEGTYTPSVRQDVIDQITAILGGSTGIPDNVWDMIFERARRKFRNLARKDEEEAYDYWASRGHILPNGALRKRIAEVADREREGVSELIREQAIQDARIYVERLNNALAQGIALEEHLVGLYNAIQTRSFEAAKTYFDIALAVAGYSINVYNAKMQAYSIKANVFSQVMQGELAKLEEVRVEIEAEKLKGINNQLRIEAYKSQITGVIAVYDVFKTQVDAVKIKYDADATRVAAYGQEVAAMSARIGAWEAEWRGYGESVKAEALKVDAYATESGAYLNRVRAYSEKINTNKIEFDANIAEQRLKLERMAEGLKKMATETEAEASRVNADVQVETLDVRAFEAISAKERDRLSTSIQRTQLLLQNAKLNADNYYEQMRLRIQRGTAIDNANIQALNAVLAANSQLAASSLSALNFATSLEGQISASASCQDIYEN